MFSKQGRRGGIPKLSDIRDSKKIKESDIPRSNGAIYPRNWRQRLSSGSWFLILSVALNIFLIFQMRVYQNVPDFRRIGDGQSRGCAAPLPTLFAQHPPTKDDKEIKLAVKSFDKLVKRLYRKRELDSLAVAVVTPAGPIYEVFRGPLRANESSWPSRGADVDGDSIFRIASVSKMFACLEALLLRDRGALDLDDPVYRYIPHMGYQTHDLSLLNPSHRTITFRQLMSHMSGLGRSYRHDFEPGVYLNTSDFLEVLSKEQLVTTPYKLPSYSSTGFALLGAALLGAVQRSEGMTAPASYEALVKRDIFDRVGMSGSSFIVDDANRASIVVPSTNSENVDYDYKVGNPSGGQMSSLADLTKLAQTLLSPHGDMSLLPADTLLEWLKPLHNYWDGITSVGMPWEIIQTKAAFGRRVEEFSKAGALPSQFSMFTLVPTHSFAVVVLSAGPDNAATEIQRLAMDYFLPAFDSALTKEVKDQLAGRWKSEDGEVEINIVVSKAQLFATEFTVNGTDTLASLNERSGKVPIWSMGEGEYRLVPILESTSASSCAAQWVTIDAAEHMNGEALNVLKLLTLHEDDPKANQLYIPALRQTLSR